MAEIKSTLDLIMEKTKGLTLSPKEKEEIRREEWLKKARGLIQKFLDDRTDLGKVQDELFDREKPLEWKNLLKRELINGLDPEGDNEKRFQLLGEFLQIPLENFLKILEAFNQRINQEKVRQTDHLIKQLTGKGVSGAAVIPNLERDPSWKRYYDQEKQACKEKLVGL
ncbi:MAG: hypothetical protein A2Y79_00950 [Deltaproteobacteria bacterium RBG_13_43_22]|nr:MAG: hypothetical protein A2Y79_00950 [Deltaproteobacteria bacterium RBG_13_43_22]